MQHIILISTDGFVHVMHSLEALICYASILLKGTQSNIQTFSLSFFLRNEGIDYPLICFGRENVSCIETANSPWNNFIDDSFVESANEVGEDDEELSLHDRYELIDLRKAEVEEDKKTFESLLDIVSDNVENDPFYNTYKKLKQTLTTEAVACQE